MALNIQALPLLTAYCLGRWLLQPALGEWTSFPTQGYSKSSRHIQRTDTVPVKDAFKTSRCPLISSVTTPKLLFIIIYPRHLTASCYSQVPIWAHSNSNTVNSQTHKSPKTASILIQIASLSELDQKSKGFQCFNSRNVYATNHRNLLGRSPQADVSCILPGPLIVFVITDTNTTPLLGKDLQEHATNKL